jgi:aquaporin Z
VNADEVFAEYEIPGEIPVEIVVTTGPGLVARLGAEAFGTFFLVLAGLGVALYAGVTGVGGALASALLYVVLASLPALAGHERSFFSGAANGFGAHSPISAQTGGEGFGLLGALLIELVVTAVFVGVILGATDRRSAHQQAPFAIGLTLAVGLLIAIPVTNGALNPARATAAAIFSDGWAFGQLWLFWVAPLAGAGIAALVYRAFVAERVRDDLLGESDTEEIVFAEEHVAETPTV